MALALRLTSHFMKRAKLFYIKERHNGQSKPYYVAYGQISAAEAKRNEKSLAGFNIMHGFSSETDYLARLEELRQQGEHVQ